MHVFACQFLLFQYKSILKRTSSDTQVSYETKCHKPLISTCCFIPRKLILPLLLHSPCKEKLQGIKFGFSLLKLRGGNYSIGGQLKDYCPFICKELNANIP